MTEQRQIYFSSNNKINKNLSLNKIDKSNESMISQTKFIGEHAVRSNFVNILKYFKIFSKSYVKQLIQKEKVDINGEKGAQISIVAKKIVTQG